MGYHPLHLAVLADPYPSYHRLRAESPVLRDRRFGWVLTRYDDVAAILRDPRASARRPLPDEPIPAQLRPLAREVREIRHLQSSWLLCTDPPRHTRLRALVQAAFTPRVVDAMRRRVQQVVDELLGAVQSAGRMDVIADLAYPLPATIIADLLGVPPADRDAFKGWSDAIAAGFTVTVAATREAYDGQVALTAYMRRLIDRRRAEPADDLLGAVIRAEADGTALSEEELLATCAMLLFAGHETTTHLIGNGVLALLRHPEQLERLRAEPALIGRAVEELLRYDGPAQVTFRRAAADVDIGGTRVEPGDHLYLLLGAANRDPDQFPHPDELDLGRQDNRHLGFAHGPHYCLGAALARLEAQAAVGTLLDRFRGLRLATEKPAWRRNHVLRGLTALPVQFSPC